MNNSKDNIDAELETLDKLLELSAMSSDLSTSKNTKKRKLSENELSFTSEMDQAFVEFNQNVSEIYRKYNMTSQAAWNASKRIMILRQKLDTKTGQNKLL